MKKQPLNNRNDGKICDGSSILPNIILYAIEEIDGVMVYPSKNNPGFIFEAEGLVIDVDVKINYTSNVPDIAFKIQESIRHNVEAMTEYKISTVNVNVKDVYFDDTTDKKI